VYKSDQNFKIIHMSFQQTDTALDTLEDLGSSILSYCLQVTKGVFSYVPKKSQIFW
jgi:hypothetical protein